MPAPGDNRITAEYSGNNRVIPGMAWPVLLLFIAACNPPDPGQAPAEATPGEAAAVADLNGVWQAMGSAHWNLEPHAAAQGAIESLGAIGAMPPGQGVIEGERIPYRVDAEAQRARNFANRRTEDPEAKCFRPGVPRATYMPYPFQIFQTDSEIFIAYQYAMATRTINLTDHMEAPFDSWMGWSNGHWEDDTLVVEVTGLNGQSWLDRSGNYVSAGARITERYTPLGPDHLRYQATIEDPAVFTEPWTISMPLYRHIGEQPEFLEFKCVPFAETLMYGHLEKTDDSNAGESGND